MRQADNPNLLAEVKKAPAFNIDENEEVLLFIHKHWIVEYKYYFLFIFTLLFIPLVLIFWSWIDPTYRMPLLLLSIVVAQFALIKAFWGWLDFYLDVIVVTNKRILDVNQDGLFHRIYNDISLMKMQNVSGEVSGIMGEWLGYGNIKIKISGDDQDMGLSNVPHPIELASKVRLMQEEQMKHMYDPTGSI